MVQESRLVISIDARNAEKSAKDLADKLKDLTQAGNNASNKSKQLGTTINQTNQITQNFNTTVNNNSRAIERNTGVVNANSNALKTLAMYMGSIVTLGEAVSKMDAWTGLQNRLKLVTQSQQELNQATQDTFAISQKTGSAWGNTVQVYQRFSDNAKTLGINMQQTARLTETVSKAVAISGATVQGAEGALIQFGQALAADRLSGEELNSVMEQTPALAKAIAEGMGLTIGQLRGVAKEGKITGAVMVDALTKMANKVDEQFGRTQMTISQSLVTLDNALIMLADGSTGASTAIGSAIQTISTNLELISSVAIVAGIGLVTKAMITQGIATKTAIGASIARIGSTTAELQSQLNLSRVELNRVKQVRALAISELDLAKAEYNSATTRTARAAATMRLTQAEVALGLAQRQTTVATNAQVLAENRLNASRSLGSRALGLVGGGLNAVTLAVMAVAAGYMVMANNAEKANQKLAEQGKIADKTADELQKLTGNDQKEAVKDLTDAFNAQNKKLAESEKAVNAVLFAIRANGVENEKVRKITEDARNGVISYTEAVTLLNKEKLSPDLYKKLKEQANQYDENSLLAQKYQKGLDNLGKEVKLAGNEAQNSSYKHDDLATSLDGVATSAQQATKELEKYKQKTREGDLINLYETGYIKQGYTPDQARALVEAQKAIGLESGILSKDQKAIALESVKIADEKNKAQDAYNDKIREETNLTKKQNRELEKGNRLVGISGNTGIGTGAHLDIRYTDKNKKMSASDLARFKAGGRPLTDYELTSGYGKRKAPVAGASTFHKGNDYAMAVGTPITTDYAVKSVETKKGSGGAGYMSIITFEDGVRISLLHQSTSVMQKVKGGRSLGDVEAIAKQTNDIILQQNKDAEQLQKEQDDMAVKLLYENMGRVEQIEEEKQRRIREIEFASFKDNSTKQAMLDDAKNRAGIETQLFKDRLNYEMNEFKASEEWKLDQSHKIKKQEITLNRELDSNARALRLQSLEAEFQQSKSYLKLIVDQRQSEYDKLYMNESQLIIQRYADEIREAQKIKDVDEKNHVARMANARRELEIQKILNNARTGWRQYDVSNDNPYASIEAEQATKSQASNELLESEILHLENQNKLNEMADFNERMAKIQQDGADRINKINEDASKARLDLNLASAQGIAGSMSDMFKSMIGEQSTAYKVMFATEKAFNIARSLVAVKTAIALASAQPFPMNLGAMATVAGLTANIVSDIMAIGSNGFKSGGYTGNGGVSDVAGVVHGKEFVLNASTTRRIGVDNLNAVNNGGDLQAVQQAQSSKATAQSPQAIDNNVKVIMVRDENEAKDMLYSSEAEKAFLYHMKRNRAKI